MTLIEQQVSAGPTPAGVQSGTNLLLPPTRTTDYLDGFPEEVYDLSAESHLTRLMKVLLGDAGVGQLRKRLLMARLQSVIASTHFYDLDRFWGSLFNVRRRSDEALSLDPYQDTATLEQWLAEHAKDASYRSRIMQFAKAMQYGTTPAGMELVAEAILNVDCDVYETWVQADAGQQTYGGLTAQYGTYGAMAGLSYGQLEGSPLPVLSANRREFVVRPKRPITLEEAYDLTRVLSRLKPADARFRIDYQGVAAHLLTPIAGLVADSNLWEIVASTATRSLPASDPYQVPSSTPVEQPRPPFGGYQGEAWSYNGDVAAMTAYQMGVAGDVAIIPAQRVVFADGSYLDYDGRLAVLPQRYVQAGRVVSDGILVASPFTGPRPAPAPSYIDANGQMWAAAAPSAPPLSPIYADRVPLTALTDAIAQVPDLDTVTQNATQRFWATPERHQDDDTAEVIEIALAGPRRVNYLTFEVAHYPQTVSAQVYNPANGNWDEVYRTAVSDSMPKLIAPGAVATIDTGHPMHPTGAHWTKFSTRITPTLVSRFRVVLTRAPGLPPMSPARVLAPGQVDQGVPLPYSLAVRNLDLGYRVTSRADVPADGPIGTTTDALGSMVEFNLWEATADRLMEAPPRAWRSEPQPVNYAVVNLYADVRDGAGAPQVIDRFYVEPTHLGVHCTIYYSAQDGVPTGDTSFFEGLTWVPISRDYVLQKGYLHLPPTRARWFKFEFTNLGAEPYESFLPMTRHVKLFPSWVVTDSTVGGWGISADALRPGQSAADTVNAQPTYSDAINTLIAQAVSAGNRWSATEALYAPSPDAAQRLQDQSWVYGFTPWGQGIQAPRFARVSVHRYDEVEIVHSTKVGFFVGLNALEAYRVDYTADDDREVYDDHYDDFLNLAPGFTWQFNPNSLGSQPGGSVATSVVLRSQHDVKAVQFATQQTDPLQIIPDDDFVDPRYATYEWDSTDDWHKVGDAQLIYSPGDNSVKMLRHVATIPKVISGGGGIVKAPVAPVFEYREFTIEDTVAEAATWGGISSGLVNPSPKGRAWAAARITADTDLSSPLILQVLDQSDNVIVQTTATAIKGGMAEWYIGYDLLPSTPVRVQLIQQGKSDDQWRLDTLSLFDDGIFWEFSVNGGEDWYPATGIRNNDNGILSFPNPGNALCYRVTGQQPGMSVSALRIRPWYVGIENARLSGTHRGPNVSTFDHEPPIQDDPMFTSWTKPIPRTWFYAARKYPILATDQTPTITKFQRFYGRPVGENIVGVSDMAVGISLRPRVTFDNAFAGSATGPIAIDPMFSGGGFSQPFDGSFYQGNYRTQRLFIGHRNPTDALTTTDSATATVFNPPGGMVNRPIHPVE